MSKKIDKIQFLLTKKKNILNLIRHLKYLYI